MRLDVVERVLRPSRNIGEFLDSFVGELARFFVSEAAVQRGPFRQLIKSNHHVCICVKVFCDVPRVQVVGVLLSKLSV